MTRLTQDPNWPRALGWLRGSYLPGPMGALAVVGAPMHLGSISPGRCDLAPNAIRRALAHYSTYDVENGRELRQLRAIDFGNLDITAQTPEEAFPEILQSVALALAEGDAVILLGGDNSITRPGCRGLGPLSTCGLLTFDAHFDLRALDHGLTNGNPIRALLADGLPGSHIAQIGIQPFSNSAAYAEVARAAGITFLTADQTRSRGIETVVAENLARLAETAESIYVDLDLDVLDRAFAPATPGSRPGGLAPWELRRALRLCGLHPKVRVLDLVEIDPEHDVADGTALNAAACLLSFASGLHQRLTGRR